MLARCAALFLFAPDLPRLLRALQSPLTPLTVPALMCVHSFAVQVSGLNYFVKIRIGSDAYAHATIWRKTDQSVHVTKVETGKTLSDPL